MNVGDKVEVIGSAAEFLKRLGPFTGVTGSLEGVVKGVEGNLVLVRLCDSGFTGTYRPEQLQLVEGEE